jgi:uncharacterized protein (DUF58 family)
MTKLSSWLLLLRILIAQTEKSTPSYRATSVLWVLLILGMLIGFLWLAFLSARKVSREELVQPSYISVNERDPSTTPQSALGREAPKPPLIKNIEQQTEAQLTSLLREVAKATMGDAPSHLDTFEKRRGTAREIGEELYRRGGMSLMKRILDVRVGAVPGQRTIDGFWDGIGEWMG